MQRLAGYAKGIVQDCTNTSFNSLWQINLVVRCLQLNSNIKYLNYEVQTWETSVLYADVFSKL